MRLAALLAASAALLACSGGGGDGAAASSDDLAASQVPTLAGATGCTVNGRSVALAEIVRSSAEASWSVGPIGNSGTDEQKMSSGVGTFEDTLAAYIEQKTGARISKEQHADGYWALMAAWEATRAPLAPSVVRADAFGSCRGAVVDAARTTQYVVAVRAPSSVTSTAGFGYFADRRVAAAAKATLVKDGGEVWLLVDPPKADLQ